MMLFVIVLFSVSFLSHYVPMLWIFCALLHYTCMYANVVLYVTVNRKLRENVKGLSSPGGFVVNALLLFYNKTWENRIIL